MMEARLAAISVHDGDRHLQELMDAIRQAGLDPDETNRLLIRAWEAAVEGALEDGLVSLDEESALAKYTSHFSLTQQDLDRNGVQTNLVQPAVTRETRPCRRQPRLTPRFSSTAIFLPSIAPFWRRGRSTKRTLRQWKGWSMRNDWVNRAAEHDSDLASRRREHTAKELERSQDDALILIRAALATVAERIKGMDAEELAAGQIPAALRTLLELEFKVLGYEDRVALTGKGGGPIKTEITGKDGGPVKTGRELWDKMLRIRAEFERLRDGDTDEDTASDSL